MKQVVNARRLTPQTAPPQELSAEKLSDDMLYGVEEISRFLGFGEAKESKDKKRIYYLRNHGWPIFQLDGIGLAARKSTLRAYIARKEREALERVSA